MTFLQWLAWFLSLKIHYGVAEPCVLVNGGTFLFQYCFYSKSKRHICILFEFYKEIAVCFYWEMCFCLTKCFSITEHWIFLCFFIFLSVLLVYFYYDHQNSHIKLWILTIHLQFFCFFIFTGLSFYLVIFAFLLHSAAFLYVFIHLWQHRKEYIENFYFTSNRRREQDEVTANFFFAQYNNTQWVFESKNKWKVHQIYLVPDEIATIIDEYVGYVIKPRLCSFVFLSSQMLVVSIPTTQGIIKTELSIDEVNRFMNLLNNNYEFIFTPKCAEQLTILNNHCLFDNTRTKKWYV